MLSIPQYILWYLDFAPHQSLNEIWSSLYMSVLSSEHDCILSFEYITEKYWDKLTGSVPLCEMERILQDIFGSSLGSILEDALCNILLPE